MRQFIARYLVEVPIREKRSTEDGRGHSWVTVGYKTASVEVSIEMADVRAIAEKAANNTSKASTSGPVFAKATFLKK